MSSVKDFRGKIEPPVEKGVLKIERYAQRLTQGYSEYGGSYLWAPAHRDKCKQQEVFLSTDLNYISNVCIIEEKLRLNFGANLQR